LSELVTRPAELRDRFEKPEGYVGYGLCDPLGQKVGSVEQLFVNPRGEPEYIRVYARDDHLRSPHKSYDPEQGS
jgi:hypothetical protein